MDPKRLERLILLNLERDPTPVKTSNQEVYTKDRVKKERKTPTLIKTIT